MYFRDFYGRLLMVIAVYVGHIWELPRLHSLRRLTFESGQEARWREAQAAAGRQFRIAPTLAAAQGF